ncbi:MAG: sigma-E factor negative regulatory protein [Gammaproteobacteria bacterium]|nr:sigma-E factor negative regulatory protein [Gammaproteobacteria bacterium]MCW8840984.1 sigma-E factor negative regulatory protein [Gammaproteobacteria bacterium]MCW8928257.1 sigma-E factor negative regulatory protein [Gammaproteobacteria bacterium]MCW8958715.1 sigma-E factor negative regulatory protein [Gammaproteobacteria bacterium]MCW8973249.1 sigma-E factor negative regulatory protein [Gammaproteobacteria bacterium]
MEKERKEWVSALADGELRDGQLGRALDALRADKALQSSWGRYHLLRDALHSNLESHIDIELHQRISAAIEQEPVLLAPQRRQRSWLKHAAGLAVAASVTGVAVLGIQQMDSTEPGTPTATMAEVMQPQNIVRLEEQAVAANSAPQQSDRLAPYVVNHNEYAVSSGMHGMLPYVRIVGHRNEQ